MTAGPALNPITHGLAGWLCRHDSAWSALFLIVKGHLDFSYMTALTLSPSRQQIFFGRRPLGLFSPEAVQASGGAWLS